MLHILKSTFCFFFLYFLSLPIFVYGQEKQLQFESVDSTEIQFPELEKILAGPNAVKHYNNCIYILKLNTDTLHKFDLATGTHSFVVMDIRQAMKRHFYPENFVIANDEIHLITANNSKILRLNFQGDILDKIKIKKQHGYTPNYYTSFYYLVKDKHYILPIVSKVNFKTKDYQKKSKKLLAYYQREGLFGCYDIKGNLIEVYGKYDTIFHQGKIQELDHYEATCNQTTFVTTQYLSSQVEIISLNSKSSKLIHLPGKNADSLFRTKPLKKGAPWEVFYNVELESNAYYSLQTLNKDSLFCRTYTVALKDTTTNPITLTPEVPTKNTCGYRTPRELRQKTLLQSQKTYFQIFDLNGTVLYDGVKPFRGFVLNDLNTNQLLTALRDKNRLVIYRYKLVY